MTLYIYMVPSEQTLVCGRHELLCQIPYAQVDLGYLVTLVSHTSVMRPNPKTFCPKQQQPSAYTEIGSS